MSTDSTGAPEKPADAWWHRLAQSMRKRQDVVLLAGGALNFVAFGLAVHQIQQAGQQQEILVETLEHVVTRRIADFPDNMEDLIGLIDSSKTELLIMCDSASYGQLSGFAKNRFNRYKTAIQSAIERTKSVRLLVYVGELQNREFARQFTYAPTDTDMIEPNPAARSEKEKGLKQSDKWRAFLSSHRIDNDKIKTWGDVYKALADGDEDTRAHLQTYTAPNGGLRMHTIDDEPDDPDSPEDESVRADPFPFFLWVATGEQDKVAIFSLPSYGDEPAEISFYTSNDSVVQALEQVANAYIAMLESSR